MKLGDAPNLIDAQGRYQVRWIPDRTVMGTPYDTPVPGYNNNTVNKLRLWSASQRAVQFQVFNAGDYPALLSIKLLREHLESPLSQRQAQGRELRLREYFFACSLHDIIRLYLQPNFDCFPEKGDPAQ